MFNLSGALVLLFGLSFRSSIVSGVAGSLAGVGSCSGDKSDGGSCWASGDDSLGTSGEDSRGT